MFWLPYAYLITLCCPLSTHIWVSHCFDFCCFQLLCWFSPFFVFRFHFSLCLSLFPALFYTFVPTHLALQPWTPCLPIRGGKLQTSKTFSTSNPQLPHLCNTGVPFPGNSGASNQQNSTNSLNSSYIWREASPNYFNLYSSSVSSLNATTTAVTGGVNTGGYRYSLSGATTNAGSGPSSLPIYERALSEERATRKSLNRMKSGFGSGYDNIFMTPLLPRKNKPSPKLVKNSYQTHQRSPPPSSTSLRNRSDSERLDLTPLTITEQEPTTQRQLQKQQRPPVPGLYDRRLNRSFETTVSHRYAGYGGGYIMSGYGPSTGYKMTPLRRSTPQLAGGEDVVDNGRDSDDVEDGPRGCSAALLRNGSSVGNCAAGDHEANTSTDGDSQRHSGSWCCGNFVMKQWRKMNNYWLLSGCIETLNARLLTACLLALPVLPYRCCSFLICCILRAASLVLSHSH